jgi:hypothetical protein
LQHIKKNTSPQGCQIFLGTWYQNRGKCTKWTQNVPIGHKISQISVNIQNGPKLYQQFPIYVRPSKICPNLDFGFEKKPSGNPASPFEMRTTRAGICSVLAKLGNWQLLRTFRTLYNRHTICRYVHFYILCMRELQVRAIK